MPIPYTTAIGSLARHCSERPPSEKFEPMNVTFGLIEDTSHSPIRDKQVRRQMMVDRALAAIGEWRDAIEAPCRGWRSIDADCTRSKRRAGASPASRTARPS